MLKFPRFSYSSVPAPRVFSVLAPALLAVSAWQTCAAAGPAATSTSLSASTNGRFTTLVAGVTAAGSPVTDGTVTFKDGNLVLGTVQIVAYGSAGYAPGTATLKTTFAAGNHNVSAAYNGDLAHATSGVGPTPITAVANPAVTVANIFPAAGGPDAYSLKAHIASTDPLDVLALSFIDQTNGDNVLGTVPLVLAPSFYQYGLSDTIIYPGSQLAGDPANLPLGSGQTVAVEDLNGDGVQDAVVTSSRSIYVFLGDPNHPGQFIAATPYGAIPATSTSHVQVKIADLNRDGLPDIVYATDNGVFVLVNNPAQPGSFGAQVAYAAPANARYSGLAVGDLNGDGIPDVLVGNAAGASLNLYAGDPANAGNLLLQSAPLAVPLASSGSSAYASIALALGDFNKDGFLDIVAAGGPASQADSFPDSGSTVDVLLSNLSSSGVSFSPATQTPTDEPANAIVVADFRGDGVLGVAGSWNMPGPTGSIGGVMVLPGDPNQAGQFLATQDYDLAGDGATAVDIATGDVNLDGLPDLVVASSPLTILYSDKSSPGDFHPTAAPPSTPANNAGGVIVKDVNQDGVQDIVSAVNRSGLNYDLGVVWNNVQVTEAVLDNVSFPADGTSFHNVFASYAGSAGFPASNSGIISLQTNPKPGQPLPTSTALSAGQTANITAGSEVQLTVVVTPSPGTLSYKAGVVNFFIDGVQFGQTGIAGGTATIQTPQLSAGYHSVVAVFEGNDSYAASTSAPVFLSVQLAPGQSSTSLAITGSSNLAAGDTALLTVQVSPSPGNNPLTAGIVSFYIDNGIPIGWSGIAGGTASFQTPQLSAGYHSIVAVYEGNDTLTSSKSAPVFLPVSQ